MIIIEDLPEGDDFRELDELPQPADNVDLLGWLMSVSINYHEACRRMANNEPYAFELLIGTYNATAVTMTRLAVTVTDLLGKDE